MTLDRRDETPPEDAEHGVLSDAGTFDAADIGILGTATAQLRVTLPTGSEDDLIDDDDVIGDEIDIEEIAAGDITLEELPVGAPAASDDIHDAVEVREEAPDGDVDAASTVDDEHASYDTHDTAGADEAIDSDERAPHEDETSADPSQAKGEVREFDDTSFDDTSFDDASFDDAAAEVPVASEADAAGELPAADEADAVSEAEPAEEAAVVDETSSPDAAAEPDAVDAAVDRAAAQVPPADHQQPADRQPGIEPEAPAPTPDNGKGQPASVEAPTVVPPATVTVPTTRREAHNTGAHQRIERAHSVERITPREPELVLSSKRLGEFAGGTESSDLLTADRLLDPTQLHRPEPEGLWQQLVYTLSAHRINLGDGRKARARKELDRRISVPLQGGARFVPVLSRKGGVGKTTVTALLGMALADARDDRVIAVDANPDRGTLADRISRTSGRTVRDLVRTSADVAGYNDISAVVARDETRLDVLSSDADPRVSEAFNDRDYRDVAVLAAHYYSLVLTDTGTGIVHSVMGATLELSDQLVIVAGLSVDEARLASETLTWLDTNGYADKVRDAVVVLNNARPGAPLVRESELEAHFRTRVRAVIRVPYDTAIGTGSAIVFRDLQPATRRAARELAAAVVEGLRATSQVA